MLGGRATAMARHSSCWMALMVPMKSGISEGLRGGHMRQSMEHYSWCVADEGLDLECHSTSITKVD